MKRALVLSGGGSKGAFEVGALYQLIHEQRIGFNLFAGSSVGAINAAFLAQGKDWTDQARKIGELKTKWENISGDRDIYHFNLLGLFGLFLGFGGAIYRPSGLRRMIETLIKPDALAAGKPLLIPTVALEDGELYIADSRKAADREEITKFVLASASIPIYFAPVKFRGKHWVDGGLRDVTPLNMVLNENPQEVVIITTYPLTGDLDPVFPPFTAVKNILSVIQRVINILVAEIGSNDLKEVKYVGKTRFFPGLRPVRFMLISPREPLCGSSLDFSPSLIKEYLDLGKEAVEEPHIFTSGFYPKHALSGPRLV